MYFNLFTPFTVADLGRAGQRLVTSTGAAHTDSASLLARGLAIRLMWEEAVLWCKRWVRHWDNQLISLLSRSRHLHTITGMGTLWEAVCKSVSDPPLTRVRVLASLSWSLDIHRDVRSTGRLSDLSPAYLQKYNLRIHTFLNISNFQQSYFIQELFQFPCKIIDNWLESIEGIDYILRYLTLFTEFSKNWECFPECCICPRCAWLEVSIAAPDTSRGNTLTITAWEIGHRARVRSPEHETVSLIRPAGL